MPNEPLGGASESMILPAPELSLAGTYVSVGHPSAGIVCGIPSASTALRVRDRHRYKWPGRPARQWLQVGSRVRAPRFFLLSSTRSHKRAGLSLPTRVYVNAPSSSSTHPSALCLCHPPRPGSRGTNNSVVPEHTLASLRRMGRGVSEPAWLDLSHQNPHAS